MVESVKVVRHIVEDICSGPFPLIMLIAWNTYRLDLLVFIAGLLVATWLVHRWLKRQPGDAGLPRIVWLGMAFFMVAAAGMAEIAGQREDDRLRQLLQGFAPTYARELERMGHHRIGFDTSDDHPDYRAMVEAQKRWLAANPAISDIYTLRRDKVGRYFLIVDSETDYDGDGRFTATREQRTAIGEEFAMVSPRLSAAFNGLTQFDARPYKDRWGVWVSIYTPMYDSIGRVDSVLGVDYDALTFTLQKSWSRASAVGIVMTVAIIYLAAALLIVNTRNESRRQLDAAMRDRLTGLPNRMLLLDRIRMAMTRMQRDPARLYAVLFIDFDHFKVINDSLGHSMGDQLLSSLADRLRAACRGSDTVSPAMPADRVAARLGGDEFVILLEDIQTPLAAAGAAARLLSVLSEPLHLQGREVQMSASIGLAIGANHYVDPEELLRDADIAMYRAKHAGRNGYAIFDQQMHAAAIHRLNLETGLRQALVREELRVVFQPVVRVSDQRVLGFEALLRWDSANGPVSPAEFIPLAEETGMIVPIGLWVLREACRNAVEWNRRSECPVFVNVNLSRKQLHAAELTASVQTVLLETGMLPHLLKLEITEGTIMDDPDRAVAAMNELRALGIELHIDDFGVGYSSLSSLNHFPINGLKLDRTFIDELDPHGQQMKIVRAVVSLARDLELNVVAEGVETEHHLAVLRRLGCPMAQGYFFAKPLSAADAAAFLRDSQACAA